MSLQASVHPEQAKRAERSASPESRTIRQFFDSIAFRYDFLNQILSFRMDDGWRKKSKELILDRDYRSLLDLGMGTGKFAEIFLQQKKWNKCVGLDFSSAMLEAARRQLPSQVGYVNGDFLNLPFESGSFDLVISAFTLRSVKNMKSFLEEIHKILTGGGKAAFLCLTRPTNPFFKIFYYPYLKVYLPLVGGIFSGNRKAYQFLADSILSFQEPELTAAMMKEIGFTNLKIYRFTFGSATLIMGNK